MRKSIIVLGLLLNIVHILHAQEGRRIRFTMVLEPSISWMKSDIKNVESLGTLPGYNFGVKMDRFFGENYAFATGLTINTAGGKLQYPAVGTTPTQNQTYRLKYIEVPLGLRLRSDDIRRVNIYGRFGLSPQLNIKSSDGNGDGIDKEVRPFDLGYHLGGGIEYSLGGRNALMLGIVFHNGFIDITKRSGFDDKAIHNRFVFEMGFIF